MRRHDEARRRGALLSALLVALAGLIVAAATANASISDFPSTTPSGAFGITSGPDNALWFTNISHDSIGRITTAGAVTKFTDPSISGPFGITSGTDGNLWFTNSGNNSIGRITTLGAVTKFTDPTISGPFGITPGPPSDPNTLWFTNRGNDSIGRITTAGAVTKFTHPSISQPFEIALGSDGNLWFTNSGNNSIGRITTLGAVTNYVDPTISQPFGIALGPDGALWFANRGNDSIGRITTAGVVTNYIDPSISNPYDITSGPDGALWFTNGGNNSIGRITTAGSVTNFTGATISTPNGIASGPDGALWFTNFVSGSIGRFELPTTSDLCSATQSCVAAEEVVASASNPSVAAVVTGKPARPLGTVRLKLQLGTLRCPSVAPGKYVQGALTSTGYSAQNRLRVTFTLRNATSTSKAQVCYRSPKPFRSQTPATSQPGSGKHIGLLLTCIESNYQLPCVLSSRQVGTSVVVRIGVPGGDPTVSIQYDKGKQTYLVGKTHWPKNKPFEAHLLIRGAGSNVRWVKNKKGRFPPGFHLDPIKGVIWGTCTQRYTSVASVRAIAPGSPPSNALRITLHIE